MGYGLNLGNAPGEGFDEGTIQAVWEKATVVTGYDPAVLRKDLCGAWIRRDQYGDTQAGGHGWEIDHIVPRSRGGTDALTNLRPLQWENNRAKGDNLDWKWQCARPAK